MNSEEKDRIIQNADRRLKEAVDSAHICFSCKASNGTKTCPFIKRIKLAEEIMLKREKDIKKEIVDALGPNPNEGKYVRLHMAFGPMAYCEEYEPITAGDYLNK